MDQSNDPQAGDRERRFECAIADYLDAAAHGKPCNLDELIAANPDLADDLRQFAADHLAVQRVANSSHVHFGIASAIHHAATRAQSAYSTPASQEQLSFSQSDLSTPLGDAPDSSLLGRF